MTPQEYLRLYCKCKDCQTLYPLFYNGFSRFLQGFCSEQCRREHFRQEVFIHKGDTTKTATG